MKKNKYFWDLGFAILLSFSVSLFFGACSENSGEEKIFPAALQINGHLSGIQNEDYELTITALDADSEIQENVNADGSFSFSGGTVSPAKFSLKEGITTLVVKFNSNIGFQTLSAVCGSIESNKIDIYISSTSNKENLQAIVITKDIFPEIKEELGNYLNRLENCNYGIDIQTFNSKATIQDVKKYLQGKQSYLKGAFFIGDLPAAWFKYDGDEFPIDLYFMDLDGSWIDANNDGVFDNHTGNVNPEIYLGRIDGSVSELKAYFKKVEAFKKGELSLPNRFLAYVDDDWTSFHYNGPYYYGLENIFSEQEVDLVYDSMTTVADDYEERLPEGYQIVQIMAHSDWTMSLFKTAPSLCTAYAHSYINVPQDVSAILSTKVTDPFKLFIDGQCQATVSSEYGTGNQAKEIPVYLTAGNHSLLMKIAQGEYYYSYEDDFNFTIKVYDENNNAIPGFGCQAEPPDAGSAAGGYITAWLVSGPFESSGTNWWQLLKHDFIGGEETADPSEADDWTIYQSPISNVNLRDAFSQIPNESVGYAYVRVISNTEKNVSLSLGYKNNGIRVWLNGNLIVNENHYDYDDEGYQSDRLLVPVTLYAGTNRLLVKVRNWWDNDFGFSVRFLTSGNTSCSGLTFEPIPSSSFPYNIIDNWLIIGLFRDDNDDNRLNYDFIQGESHVQPKSGDSVGTNSWKKFDTLNTYIDLNNSSFFGIDGGYFTNDLISGINPKVHFYNQFNCSGARYVETPCLGYRYIHDSSETLLSVGSTKTGSMLYFEDYYQPLAEGKSFGEAFLHWYIKHGNSDWGWFYGMTLLGDPTLSLHNLPEKNSLNSVIHRIPMYHLSSKDKALLWKKMMEMSEKLKKKHPPMTYKQYIQRRKSISALNTY